MYFKTSKKEFNKLNSFKGIFNFYHYVISAQYSKTKHSQGPKDPSSESLNVFNTVECCIFVLFVQFQQFYIEILTFNIQFLYFY